MMKHRISLLLLALGFSAVNARADDADKIAFFEAKIRPVLVETCMECHGDKKASGKLRLDSKAGVLKGGSLWPGYRARQSEGQPAHQGDSPRRSRRGKMPPKGAKLADAVIADFEKWIDMGAPDPRDGKASRGIGWLRLEEGPQFLVVPAAEDAAAAERAKRQLGEDADRSLHPRQAGSGETEAGAPCRQARTDSPGHLRSDRPAADAGGSRSVRQG